LKADLLIELLRRNGVGNVIVFTARSTARTGWRRRSSVPVLQPPAFTLNEVRRSARALAGFSAAATAFSSQPTSSRAASTSRHSITL
jgi:hypothetical protein